MLIAQRVMYGPTHEFRTSVPIKPKGQGRPRFGRGGHAYTPEPTRAYNNALRDHFKKTWGDREALTGALIVRIEAEFQLPKSASKKGRAHHVQRPDVDNVAKAALDALMPEVRKHKIIWPGVIRDDAQVVELTVKKYWSIAGNYLHVFIWSTE